MTHDSQPTRASYDRVAEAYTRQFIHEFDHKPLDRQLLDRFAGATRGRGRVCDLGCGPGHLAGYLCERGVEAFGTDLAPAMAACAHSAYPSISFLSADMRALPLADGALAGIAAFYCIIHIPRPEIVATLRELRRVLQPGGTLFLTFHIGEQIVHVEEFLGQRVNLDFAFFLPAEMRGYLEAADFHVDEIIEREPYPEVEHQSRRAYIFASRPGA